MQQNLEFNIDGMTCGGCAASITKGLTLSPEVKSCDIDVKSKKAVINTTLPPEVIKEKIEDMGFDATYITSR